nr:eukaryotic translation initiation factor 3 subunit A-like [Rhipicephalus microplus]
MPTYFQRPENALKRAREFIDVGKKHRALDALYDVIKSRKHRTWQKVHEPIMQQYLELCVELKKSHIAKEGLFQYRNICQQVNIKSLEDVVRGYLDLAEEKTEAAREESQQAVVDIDDLDNVQTPESLLLSAVSSEDTQDRTDRVVLTPWVKFLWESYRQCLELLRNNSRVESLYHDIARQAFKFCLKYSRKTEFRKLCDHLRAHLGQIHRHQSQQTSVNLNNPESQAMHLETRLVQLDSAIQMELWQVTNQQKVHSEANIFMSGWERVWEWGTRRGQLQPLDAGVIKCMRQKYGKFLVQRRLAGMERKQLDKKLPVLDANDIGFKRSGACSTSEAAVPVDDEPEFGDLELPGSFADYVGADDDVAVCSAVLLDDIIQNCAS